MDYLLNYLNLDYQGLKEFLKMNAHIPTDTQVLKFLSCYNDDSLPFVVPICVKINLPDL